MSKRRGFTMVELIVVIVITLILSIGSLVTISNALKSIRLVNAADKLASDLRYAQYMSGSIAKWYGVSFEADPTNQYTVYTTTGTADTVVADPARAGSDLIVNLGGDYNIKITSVSFDGGKKVEFSPNGTPYTDKNGSPLAAEGVITLSNGSASRMVRVTPNTGRVFEQ